MAQTQTVSYSLVKSALKRFVAQESVAAPIELESDCSCIAPDKMVESSKPLRWFQHSAESTKHHSDRYQLTRRLLLCREALFLSPTSLEDRILEQIGILLVALGVRAVELELGAAA